MVSLLATYWVWGFFLCSNFLHFSSVTWKCRNYMHVIANLQRTTVSVSQEDVTITITELIVSLVMDENLKFGTEGKPRHCWNNSSGGHRGTYQKALGLSGLQQSIRYSEILGLGVTWESQLLRHRRLEGPLECLLWAVPWHWCGTEQQRVAVSAVGRQQ